MREKEHNAYKESIVGLLAESEVKGAESAVELLVGSKWSDLSKGQTSSSR